jgi:tetratricopeptide (TPR) repeat protein
MAAHLSRGLVELRREQFPEAAAWLETALNVAEQPEVQAWRMAVASPLARAWLELGRLVDADALLEPISVEVGRGNVIRTIHLGETKLRRGQFGTAADLAAKALALARQNGERGHEAYSLLFSAECSQAQGKSGAAAELASEALIPIQ